MPTFPTVPISLAAVVSGNLTSVTVSWQEPLQPVATPGSPAIADAAGNLWTIAGNGAVLLNRVPVPGGGGTAVFTINNGLYWGQDAASKTWYTYTLATRTWGNPTTVSPVPSPASTTYQVRWRKRGTLIWTVHPVSTSVTTLRVTGLTPMTTYEMEVLASGN